MARSPAAHSWAETCSSSRRSGARTGQPRLAPLAYDRDGDRLVIVGSKRGEPTHPAWYLNLLANPIVTVEVGAEKFQARAVVAQDAERDRLFAARVERAPIFAEYQQQTERILPVVLLERIP